MSLSRQERMRELGLAPAWRLRTPVAPASLPASSTELEQGIHTRGYLPHVKADGATYFVTFRLADSMPVEVLASWKELPDQDRNRRIEEYLDKGAGACWLGQPEVADLVANAVRKFAGERYELSAWVVMPNHVHALLKPLPGHTLSDILHSLKSWTAQQANQLLGRVGQELWQHESYDHVVRDQDELDRLAWYVRQNPVTAKLVGDESSYRWSSAFVERAGKDAGATKASDLDWDALRSAIRSCTLCPLHKSRTQSVPGVGDIHAEWLFIGEAPGADEDRQGEPFVGQAGKLLDAMLEAIRLKRGENVYIANVLKSRPPANRDPEPAEVSACLPYLERQIALIRPKLIVALGRFAAQSLLNTDTPIGKLRGRVHSYQGVPMVVTYHPAYLLRNPADKAKVWEDLVLATRTMRNLTS